MKKFCLFIVSITLCTLVCAQSGPGNDPRWKNNLPSPYPQDSRKPSGHSPNEPGVNYRPGQETRQSGYRHPQHDRRPDKKEPGANDRRPDPNYRPGPNDRHPGPDYRPGPNDRHPDPNYRPGPNDRRPAPAPAPGSGHHDSKPKFGISIGPHGIGFSVSQGGHRPFSVDFWKSYKYNGPTWGYMAAGPRRPDSYWMGTTSWNNLRGFFPYRWDRPIPMGPRPQPNYQMAAQLAFVNRHLPPNYNPAQEQWLPLGTFVMADDLNYTQDSSYYVQLAVNRDGFVSGSMFNSQDNQVLPVVGRIDPRTQQLAFSVQGWSEVFSTSVYDLTQNQASVLVMRGPQDYQVDYMVRVQN